MSETIELRPFPPFLPPQATVLMMGSFPPAAEKGPWTFTIRIFKTICGAYTALYSSVTKIISAKERNTPLTQTKSKHF